MRRFTEKLLASIKPKRSKSVHPNSKYFQSNVFENYFEQPEIQLHSIAYRDSCSVAASPMNNDLILVYSKAEDSLHFVDTKEAESFISQISLNGSPQALSIAESIKLNTSSGINDAVFLDSEEVLIFITPDGLVQKWNAKTRELQPVAAGVSLKHPICPTFNAHKEKLYYFTEDCVLHSLDLVTGGSQTISKFDCESIVKATLLKGMEDLMIIQADNGQMFWHNVETKRTERMFHEKQKQFYQSSILSSLVLQSGNEMSIMNFETGFSESRISLHSPALLRSRPVSFSRNSSGPYHAIGFENGSICLVEASSWREECIINKEGEYLQEGDYFVELFFSFCGQFLFGKDQAGNLHKFMIKQNLRAINQTNLQRVAKDPLFGLFSGGKYNFEEELRRDERSSSMHQSITDLRRNYRDWLSNKRDIYNIEEEGLHPITISKVPGRNLLITVDSDSWIRVWNVFGQQCTIQINEHISYFKHLSPKTIFYWEYLKVFIVVFSEVLLFVEDSQFLLIGHLELNTGENIVQAQSFGTILYIKTENEAEHAYEFVGERLTIKASRVFPATFNLYEPTQAKLLLYPEIQSQGIPFYPKVFLNHAFQAHYDSYSPVLFQYKVRNYQGLNAQNIDNFTGHEHVLFHYTHFSLMHLYAFNSRNDLLSRALARDAPLLIDLEGHSPLSIAIDRKTLPCIKALLDYLREGRENLLYNNVAIIKRSQFQIPKLPLSEAAHAFYALDIDPQPKFKLPVFANMNGSNEKIIPLKDKLPNEVLPDRKISQKQRNDVVNYQLSRMDFDITFGSKESIQFFDNILNSPHVQIFDSPAIQSLIRYKWGKAKIFFIVECTLFLFYLAFISAHAIRNRDDRWIVALVFCFSVLHCAEQIWQMIGQKCSYFHRLWNWVDLTGIISIWTYCGLFFRDTQQGTRLVLLTYSCALIWWKSFSYTRFKQPNRYFIRTVGVTFSDIRHFLSFMVLYTIAFSVIFLATWTERELQASRHSWLEELFLMYQFDLGRYNPTDNTLTKLIYIPATIFVSIMLFNLLIAIVRDSYLKVKSNRVANDYMEIANIINDYQTMARWNFKKSNPRYLFIIQDITKKKGANDLDFTHRKQNQPKVEISGVNPQMMENKSEMLMNSVDKLVKKLQEVSVRLARVEQKLDLKTDEMLKVQADQSHEMKRLFFKSNPEEGEDLFNRPSRISFQKKP